MASALVPVQVVRVHGPSMVPTLRHGDLILAWHRAPIRPGDVVLARFASMPDRWVIKRAERRVDGGWWLTSDNVFAGGDSRAYGVAEVVARIVLRFGVPMRLKRPPEHG